MVSGFVQAHEVSDILRDGVNRFVPKPIDNEQLAQYISDMLEIADQTALAGWSAAKRFWIKSKNPTNTRSRIRGIFI